MSRPRTHEQRLLAQASALIERALDDFAAPAHARLDILEATAALHADWDLDLYRQRFPRKRYVPLDAALVWGQKLAHTLAATPISVPLAISALSHSQLDASAQRAAGAYYTDFRLAQHLVDTLPRTYGPDERVIDLAAGSGILLVALTLHVSAGDTAAANAFVRDNVCAADLDPEALDATRTALAATVNDLEAVNALNERLLSGDSLTRTAAQWERLAPGGFAAVIGNPPWEKLKVTRHEVLTAAGVERHYGSAYNAHDHAAYADARTRMLEYVDALGSQSRLQGKGESDLYKLFLELAARVVRPSGDLALLLPAGLIRSQGTAPLRAFLFEHAQTLSMTVLENRASFFAIDSRFKFLSVLAKLGQGKPTAALRLHHGTGTANGVQRHPAVIIDRKQLARLRPDLTVPEVRTKDEWRIFTTMAAHGRTLDDPRWRHTYARELDMTNDRHRFLPYTSPANLPILEGRMVHQHRVHAKAYLSGTGRAATWQPLTYANATAQPQFWYPRALLSPALRERVAAPRAGFCDITGQTNERTLLAALIPAGVVCGNKVPTLTFDVPDMPAQDAASLWVALANTFAVDWVARRVVTTTVNYFLLRTLPLPVLGPHELAAVLQLSRTLAQAEGRRADLWALAEARARIDAIAATALHLDLADLQVLLSDFRLIDRRQPALPGEEQSTVTTDMVLATYADLHEYPRTAWHDRVERARAIGAVPYVPADYARVEG
ncbi:N-6 DNA methylase [Cellulomonas sp.]|uniref:Eco57I restriction-modification methylase domain-containing protein n=1 Tax=Cellulomonas sp. TaxID=40001 RepID=UPI00258B7839|nr:N-6 DNA methylase [Cellulomonas sp.]MCR6688903.1 hypothetical protein [Cellulomonas sp.]